MRLHIAFTLPRDEATVGVVRHLCGMALQKLGVTEECIAELQLVLSEACANVVRHAADGDDYGVDLTIDEALCRLTVIDRASRYEPSRRLDSGGAPVIDLTTDDPLPEGGRGVVLMKTLVDALDFQLDPVRGTVVHLEKELVFADSGPSVSAPSARGTRRRPSAS